MVDVAAGGDEVTTSEVLIEVGVVTSVELVDRHLPDGVASAWTVPRVAVALVRHPGGIIRNILSLSIVR